MCVHCHERTMVRVTVWTLNHSTAYIASLWCSAAPSSFCFQTRPGVEDPLSFSFISNNCHTAMSSMLFGLFSRKQSSPGSFTFNREPQDQDTQTQTQADSRPETPPSSTTMEPMQLRTPSPSIDSHSNIAGPSSPGIKGTIYRPMSPLQNSLSQLAVHSDSESQSSPEQQSQKLYRLIASVPAKTLHQYTLSKLRAATNPSTSSTSEHHLSHATLAAVADFFVDLHPPPKLHCVRCHKEYVEVENDSRSCTVAHDDESTLVERVGRSAGRSRGGEDGSEYETLWQCCEKTVEGAGDQGPPDGWCYEGKHTVNQPHAFVSTPVSLTLCPFPDRYQTSTVESRLDPAGR
jgi:hypothetical protein